MSGIIFQACSCTEFGSCIFLTCCININYVNCALRLMKVEVQGYFDLNMGNFLMSAELGYKQIDLSFIR